MSGELPHSAIHATQVVDLDEKDEKGGESAVKSVVSWMLRWCPKNNDLGCCIMYLLYCTW